MKKVIVIDLMDELGHVNTNKRLMNILKQTYEVTFVTTNEYLLKFEDVNVNKLQIKKIKIPTKLGFRMSQLLMLFKVRKLVMREEYQIAVFFTYETISMSLFTYFLPHKSAAKSFVFNHNNIDQLSVSKVKKLFFQNMNSTVRHLVYEDYIKQYLTKEFKKTVKIIYHPLPLNYQSGIKKRFQLFSPSAGGKMYNEEILQVVSEIADLKVYLKGDNEVDNDNYVIKPRYENYFELLQNSAFVFVPVDYKYRVSGVIYEALANNCVVILLKSLLSLELQLKFPDEIHVIDKVEELPEILRNSSNFLPEIPVIFKQHNDESISKQFDNLV